MSTMNTENERAPAKPTGHRYSTVRDLMKGEGIQEDIQSKVAEIRKEMGVALHLAVLRQKAGITQDEMAKHLGVTQPTISKLESGRDEEITLRDIREYAKVTGERISVMFGKPFTHAEAIKLCASGLKKRLEALAAIANENAELQSEIKGFMGEAFYNLFNIIASCNDKLPVGEDDVEIRIEIVRMCNKAQSAPSGMSTCQSSDAVMA